MNGEQPGDPQDPQDPPRKKAVPPRRRATARPASDKPKTPPAAKTKGPAPTPRRRPAKPPRTDQQPTAPTPVEKPATAPPPPHDPLHRLRVEELSRALREELDALEQRLPDFLDDVLEILEDRLTALREEVARRDQAMANADSPARLFHATQLEKIARRVARFRALPQGTLADLLKLDTRLAKSLDRLRRK